MFASLPSRRLLQPKWIGYPSALNSLRRMADPAEIGTVAAFLASRDSSFMTASEIAVDGGIAQI